MIIHRQAKLLQQGFTLLELTIAVVIGMMLASMTLVLFSNQLTAFSMMRSQNFMIQEAPQINTILNSLVSRATAIRFDEDDDSKITLGFIDPSDNSVTTAEIAFVDGVLTYTSGDVNWDISAIVADVTFAVDSTGVLKTTLTGPNAGEITYSATPLQ